MRNLLTTLAETVGMFLITAGVSLYSIPAGMICGGVALLTVGLVGDL